MKGWIMFNKIKTLKEQNLKVTQIARILNSDVRTINKYWNMSSEEFELLRTQYKQRIVGRKMDVYEQLIISWIKEFNDISGAQVFDWLKERDQNFSMAERTVRSYVEKLRKKYELPKLKVSRQYLAIPETLPAEQAQVDMGQINLLTEDKKTKSSIFLLWFYLSQDISLLFGKISHLHQVILYNVTTKLLSSLVVFLKLLFTIKIRLCLLKKILEILLKQICFKSI